MHAKAKECTHCSATSGIVSRMVVPDSLEVDVIHRVFRRHSLGMVVPQHLAQQIETLVRHKLVVLAVNEFGPGLSRDRVLGQKVIVVGVEDESVLVEVGVELLRAQDLGNLDELVVVVTTLEEGLSLEDHAGEHATERPDVK